MDCPSGKVQHTLATAKSASKRARQRTDKPLVPYRCEHCGMWHVGQSNGMKRRIKTVYGNHQLRFT